MKHSVILNEQRCRGCTTCIKCCPTEAIRIRGGKATILDDRCIDCGRCIPLCPHKAIRSDGDPLKRMEAFSYCVALPEPALYGQFRYLKHADVVLNGLLKLGFDQVWEVARATELLWDGVRQSRWRGAGPQISSSCPAVLRLIESHFPELIPQVVPTILPMELAAILARRAAAAETGLPPEEIGVFAIVPCSAKVTAAAEPERLPAPVLDGTFAIRDIYLRLLPFLQEKDELCLLASAGQVGLGSAFVGGDIGSGHNRRTIAVDGIDNVIRMLEALEDGRMEEAEYVELAACPQGCLGGCFNVENPYAARMRIEELMAHRPMVCNHCPKEDMPLLWWAKGLQHRSSLPLDQDLEAALEKSLRIQQMEDTLPGLQCASCGAPSCRAFAEDVVMGRAVADDCVFRKKERRAAGEGGQHLLPAPFRR